MTAHTRLARTYATRITPHSRSGRGRFACLRGGRGVPAADVVLHIRDVPPHRRVRRFWVVRADGRGDRAVVAIRNVDRARDLGAEQHALRHRCPNRLDDRSVHRVAGHRRYRVVKHQIGGHVQRRLGARAGQFSQARIERHQIFGGRPLRRQPGEFRSISRRASHSSIKLT